MWQESTRKTGIFDKIPNILILAFKNAEEGAQNMPVSNRVFTWQSSLELTIASPGSAMETARDDGAVAEVGGADKIRDRPVPHPLPASLSLRYSWLLPGVLEKRKTILSRGVEAEAGQRSREPGCYCQSVGAGREAQTLG